MPELPEVEVTRMGIAPYVEGQTIERMVVRQAQLRWPIQSDLAAILSHAQVLGTQRRGKYLVLLCRCADDREGVLLIHLGMSGSLRIVAHDAPIQKHDHVEWVFAQHSLRYHDPRRFGAVLWHPSSAGDWQMHPRLQRLGLEPFDVSFDGAYVYRATRSLGQAIKVALMSGTWVVGVGNIYASEVLFLCGIHPERPARELSRAGAQRLAQFIPKLLQSAIDQGGSTLKDFVHSDGTQGYFQMHFNVYDREHQACYRCQTPIQRTVQAQRATYFCPKCQK